MTRKIKKPVINVKLKRSGQGKETEEQTKVEDQVVERTFYHLSQHLGGQVIPPRGPLTVSKTDNEG